MSFSDKALNAAQTAQSALQQEEAAKAAEAALIQQRRENIFYHCASLAVTIWKESICAETEFANFTITKSWIEYLQGDAETQHQPVASQVNIHASWELEGRKFLGKFNFSPSIMGYRLRGPHKGPLSIAEIIAMEQPLSELDDAPRYPSFLIEIAADSTDPSKTTLLPANTLADIGTALVEETHRIG